MQWKSLDQVAFFQAIRAVIAKATTSDARLAEENRSAVLKQILDSASAVDLMGDEALKKIAVEITEQLRNSTSVDWQKRESVRAAGLGLNPSWPAPAR